MAVLPVFVEDWQHECCGDDFAVGDTVAWRLLLIGDPDGSWGWPDELLSEFHPTGRREFDGGEIVTVSGGLQIAVDPSAGAGAVVRGSLREEHHGGVPEDVRPVEGVVRRLRVVRQQHRRRGREWSPVAGAVELHDVAEMPGSFGGWAPEGREAWVAIGAVADLELA